MKKRFLALLAAGALLLTGCGAQGAANSNAEAGGDGGAEDNLHHLTVVLDWYPNALHAFLYEAQEKGYFAEEGLDVDIAQRIIDFTSGSCFAISGNLQKISHYIFIITPASVDISGDFQDIFGGAGSFEMPINNGMS